MIFGPSGEVGDVLLASFSGERRPAMHIASLAEARQRLSGERFDAVLIASDAPEDDVGWCAALRDDGHSLPILVIGSRSTVAHRIAVFDAGTDDFVARPFAIAELRARLRAIYRRAHRYQPAEVDCGHVRIDLAARRVWRGTMEVDLTAREWSLVDLTARRRGHVVPRTELLSEVWGAITDANQTSLDVIVGRVRRKLGVGFIQTVRAEGYVLP